MTIVVEWLIGGQQIITGEKSITAPNDAVRAFYIQHEDGVTYLNPEAVRLVRHYYEKDGKDEAKSRQVAR